MNEQRRGQRPAALAVGLLSILILLTACGSGPEVATIDGVDGATPTPSASAASEDPEEAMFAFAECMREHGIDMPDPTILRSDAGDGAGGGGIITDEAGPGDGPQIDPNSDEFQAAQEACEHHLEGLGAIEPGDGPELTPEQEEAFLAFTECMREHGIDMPDFGTGGAVRIGPDEAGPNFDPFSDEFQAAREECDELLEGVEGLDGPGFNVSGS